MRQAASSLRWAFGASVSSRKGLQGASAMLVRVVCTNPDCGEPNSIPAERSGRPGACHACGVELKGLAPVAAPDLDRTMCHLPDVVAYRAPESTIADLDHDEGADDDTPVPRSSDLPTRFGRFQILRRLGQGGMGAVYLAHDTELDRPVALKVPHANFGFDPGVAERFRREARAAANFNHPNFCPIYDVGQADGRHFLAMAYIDGETLCSKVDPKRPMPPDEAAEVARELARAMAEAHRLGIVHRDLKPANVMVDGRGRLIIMDFGIARRAGHEDVELTRTGQLIGTPHYMSPEQMLGEKQEIGPSTDLYALGVIFYELLTGHRPFEGSATFVIGQVLHAEPPRPSQHRPGLDPALEAICLKAMAKRPELRYASMDALADDLDRHLRPGTSKSQDPRRPRRRSPILPLAVVVSALAAIALGGYLATDRGTLRLEGLGPGMVVRIDGREVNPGGTGRTYAVRSGEHELLVSKGEALLESEKTFFVRRGRETVVAVTGPRPIEVARTDLPGTVQNNISKETKDRVIVVPPVPPATSGGSPPADRANPETPLGPPKPLATESQSNGDRPRAEVTPGPSGAGTAPAGSQPEPGALGMKIQGPGPDQPPRFEEPPPPPPEVHRDPMPNEPDPVSSELSRGVASFNNRDYTGAIERFDRVLDQDKTNGKALFLRGRAMSARGRPDWAITDFSEVIRLDRTNAAAYAERGLASLAKGNRDGALADIDRAIQLDPKAGAAYAGRGIARYEAGQLEGSIADLAKAIKLTPDDPRPHARLAWILATSDRPEIRDGREALRLANLACQMTGLLNAEALASMAAAYAEVGNFAEAVSYQDEAVDQADEETKPLYRLYAERYSREKPLRIPAGPKAAGSSKPGS